VCQPAAELEAKFFRGPIATVPGGSKMGRYYVSFVRNILGGDAARVFPVPWRLGTARMAGHFFQTERA
jgi:hypothetical protein